MGWVAAVLILATALLLLAWLPIRLHLTALQVNLQANLIVEVRFMGLRLVKSVDISQKAAMVVEHMWKRWRAKGEPVDPDFQETLNRFPGRQALQAALPALRYLGRSTRCSQLRLRLEVGGFDAFESALLAGLGWSGCGLLVGQISRWVRLEPTALAVAVVPNFAEPTWQGRLDGIASIRLGQAIKAIVWLLRQELSRKEVIAWLRDSQRRKGDQTGGRPPDSRPDEDGHGEP